MITISENQKDKIIEEILRLRISQLIINEFYKAGKFKIPIHLALGHEAVAVALSCFMEPNDKILLTHRNVAYNLALGATLKQVLNEYLLSPEGLSHGIFGSMNMIQPERGAIYTSSILGNQFPVGVGVSLGSIINHDKNSVVITLGGDGSMEEGALYEAIIMAKSVEAPVLYVIENNEWSMHTKISERRKPIDLFNFTKSLGAGYVFLNGNDPLQYIHKLKEARSLLLGVKSPVCVEVAVTTLGDWRGPQTEEFPEGKFINYHAGPTPGVPDPENPIIKNDETDPVFFLKKYFGESVINEKIKNQFTTLKTESDEILSL